MATKQIPTYIPFLDKVLGGGQQAVGVHGILGPTGVGKSHLSIMIAVNGATHGSIFEEEVFHSPPWVLLDLGSAEGLSKDRILSHVAKVKRSDVYSDISKIQEYEKKRQSELPSDKNGILSTKKRLTMARYVLPKQLLHDTYNFFYDDQNGESIAGASNATELMIDRLDSLPEEGDIGGIVIDGVGDLWLYANDTSVVPEHVFIRDFVSKVCRQLSEKHRCPVWVTHQVKASACEASPLAGVSHYDAARCKSFADGLDACVVLGPASDLDFVFSIQCTKGPQNSDNPERIALRYDDDFASIVEAKDFVADRKKQTWRRNVQSQTILKVEEHEYFQSILNAIQQEPDTNQRPTREARE